MCLQQSLWLVMACYVNPACLQKDVSARFDSDREEFETKVVQRQPKEQKGFAPISNHSESSRVSPEVAARRRNRGWQPSSSELDGRLASMVQTGGFKLLTRAGRRCQAFGTLFPWMAS